MPSNKFFFPLLKSEVNERRLVIERAEVQTALTAEISIRDLRERQRTLRTHMLFH